jgi:hypothetical protein
MEALEGTGGSITAAGERSSSIGQGEAFPEGQRNHGLARLAGVMRRAGFGASEIHAALDVANRERCSPPLKSFEVRKIADNQISVYNSGTSKWNN